MKIAVTYENGQIFQHFGHTEQFKLYEVTDGKIVHAEIVEHQRQRSRRTGQVSVMTSRCQAGW